MDAHVEIEHEKRAKDFVLTWEAALLGLLNLDRHELTAHLFTNRNKLVSELRQLLRDERIRGCDDAQQEFKEQLAVFVRERL